MSKEEQSREQWERELWERQFNITPAQSLRTAGHIAKGDRWVPPLRDFQALLKLVAGGVLIGLGLEAFPSHFSHRVAIGLTALACGFCLVIKAFVWRRTDR